MPEATITEALERTAAGEFLTVAKARELIAAQKPKPDPTELASKAGKSPAMKAADPASADGKAVKALLSDVKLPEDADEETGEVDASEELSGETLDAVDLAAAEADAYESMEQASGSGQDHDNGDAGEDTSGEASASKSAPANKPRIHPTKPPHDWALKLAQRIVAEVAATEAEKMVDMIERCADKPTMISALPAPVNDLLCSIRTAARARAVAP